MIGRIASRTTAMTSLANLQASQVRSDRIQQQLTSGKAYVKLSDNPVAANDALRFRSEIAVNEQYGRNISDGQRWLSVQEGSLGSVTNSLHAARDALVQANNAAIANPAARGALAAQLRSIRDDLLAQANTQHEGHPVFGGTTTAGTAVAATFSGTTGTYTITGDEGAVTRRVAPGHDVRVNATATEVFGGAGGTPTVFQQLDALAAAVESGDTTAVGAGLATIDAARDRVLSVRGALGARVNQLEALEQANAVRGDALSGSLDEVEGVDIAKAMIEFRLQDTAYQAALATTAKVIQPTLLDFLR